MSPVNYAFAGLFGYSLFRAEIERKKARS